MSALQDFIHGHRRLFLLTGAGCSTGSGIPDYRDEQGAWKRRPPVMYQAFVHELHTRQRYWARSLVGWQRLGGAQPNAVHRALQRLEQMERVELLLTQNVDGLHQAAGSRRVLDLHGRIDTVRCLHCGLRLPRAQWQSLLLEHNPCWPDYAAEAAPDGDADLELADFAAFQVPGCPQCGGLIKPDVVFFGEAVPPARVTQALQALAQADAVLVLGSSLMVYSGFRFVRQAHERGLPIAAVNLGRTRADELLQLKLHQACGEALAFLLKDAQAAL
ncbi:NAD-dependent protein deacetylase, SIR2 family [Solimonas aquatica]|uniref:NAD-dependent protein deacetylase n=1 Tax=Solimonas aquatica TaxID=489703 RepID=A0A1H9FKA6_9GAMM|nr:NAD-dependent protein deacetylase [Solimonas aquatica]SEQ38357.1 NAD-dependent protein deacetylase, SIR2 family [Solimonas aquatica]